MQLQMLTARAGKELCGGGASVGEPPAGYNVQKAAKNGLQK